MKSLNTSTPGRLPTDAPSRVFLRAGELGSVKPSPTPAGYWTRCRGASAAILLVLPLLATYEAGIASLGGDPGLRTGVDAWIGRLLPDPTRVPDWAPSLTLALGLICWRIADPAQFRVRWLAGAFVESVALGAGLVGVFLLFDRWFDAGGLRIPMGVELWKTSGVLPAEMVGLIGAGIFEEAVFRLGLLGIVYAVLRLLLVPNVLATALAVSGSALAFSMAHHLGEPPGAFEWSTFVFRWLAGVYFSWVFILRGFGIAVGTHVAYDLLVAVDAWSA